MTVEENLIHLDIASAMPPIHGVWLNPQTQELIIEEPVVTYSDRCPPTR